MLLRILFLALLVYVGLALVIFLFQGRLVFLPHVAGRDLVATPHHLGLVYDDVELHTADGETLHGWWLPHSQARGTLLFKHGNAGNISHRLDSLRIFNELGLNVLIFDYRGYGQSSGRPSEQGTYKDARAAWDWLIDEAGVQPGEVILFGRSMGGAIAAQLATEVRPAGVIVESSFSSIADIASEYYGWLPVRWLTRIHFPTADFLAQTDVPVLVVHSREDEIVRFEHAER
ncbi:MAG: alpha/beta hydrolase, partial [Wenzhouxiangella sp.]